ncbi:DNA-packaging protein [Pseudogemmobacter faecipullorum]|uniref:DNA-packaging protein n=1 Tax=Pseudogemmobacter faecipullorum TaxID=2755041 RepID=A0ABS8CKX1_9RHOB|nr:terminase family protein [Pseudogemmobacter faecipullorum]MCB5410006.1 DNA-packaging protein [Pseudogemmobacter faecipullorum]
MKSGAAWLACAPQPEIEAFLAGLSENALLALPWIFDFWALPHQLPPEGAWKTWVVMGGRGAGKTRAGAEWVRHMVEGGTPEAPGQARRLALVAETLEQAREVMVLGESGILACSPPDRRPKWNATRNCLEWQNGAVAQLFSAHDPERLRGPQFDAAWADELAKWPKAAQTWEQLQFGLRLGSHPQQMVTTTPRNLAVLKAILANPSTVITHAPTEANRAWLAASFLEEIGARYGGTTTGRQEMEGLLIEEEEGALWSRAMIEAAGALADIRPGRVVVAVDPPVTAHKRSDECGIVVVGLDRRGGAKDWRALVLADRSLRGASPDGWARAALAAMSEFGADRLVVEVNQGGDLVASVVRQIDPVVPIREVRAMRGKMLRAEPVAALYEQGRVGHVRGLAALEAQMLQMTRAGWQGQGSPDRLDALVWAMTELMAGPGGQPGLRSL